MIINLQKHAFRGCLIIVLLLGACATPPAEEPQPEPVTLKVAHLPYLSHAPFFIAEEEGYFAEQGLQIEIIRLPKLTEAIPTLAQGDLDVLGGAIDVGLLNAMARGAGIKFVADRAFESSTGCAYTALMASRALVEAGELEGPAQLHGRRISMVPSAFSAYFVDKILSTAGLTLDDVDIVNLPENLELEALEKGTIDLAVTSEPWLTRHLQSGHSVLWRSVQETIPNFQFGIIVYGPTLLEVNPDTGKRFMVAYLKAVRQYNQGKTERNLEILAKYTELDQELLSQACWPSFRDDGQINAQSVLDYQAWAAEKGYLDSILSEDQFWNPSFVEHTNQVLGAPTQ